MDSRAINRRQKIEQMWIEAYERIFSNPELYGLVSQEVLSMIKNEALKMQLKDLKENFHTYHRLTIKKIQESIDDVADRDGYKIAKELVDEFKQEMLRDEDCWEA